MVKVTASENFTPAVWRPPKPVGTLVFMREKRHFRRTFIREWRQHRGLTLEQLAERLDMTASYLSMLERGQRGYSQDTLEAVAEALQTDPASLLMRNPADPDAIWSIWDNAKPGTKRQIIEVAKALARTGTE